MAISRVLAKGNRLYYARAATPTTFVRLGGVVSIGGINLSRENVDATELDNAPDSIPGGETEEMYEWKQKMAGTKDAEALALEVNLIEATYAILNTMFLKNEIGVWKIVFRSGAVMGPFNGYVEKLGMDLQQDQLVKTPLSIMPEAIVAWVGA